MENFKEELKSKVGSDLFDIIDIALEGNYSSEDELLAMLDNIENAKESYRMFTLSSGDVIDLKDVKRARFNPIYDDQGDLVPAIQLNKGCTDKENFSGEIIELYGTIEDGELETDQFNTQLLKYKK